MLDKQPGICLYEGKDVARGGQQLCSVVTKVQLIRLNGTNENVFRDLNTLKYEMCKSTCVENG